jgi:hypothetical protein
MKEDDMTATVAPAASKPTGHRATAEQRAIIEAACQGGDIRLYGLAGAAKTSTLRAIAHAMRDRKLRGVYLAFNRAIAEAAKGKFPPWVQVMTQHSLAYRTVGVRYKHRIQHTGASFKIRKAIEERFGAELLTVSWNRFGALKAITSALNAFLYSDADCVLPVHFDRAHLRDAGIYDDAGARTLLSITQRAFDAMRDIDDSFPISHDVYLKIFALDAPDIGVDVILYDESQDANPVSLQIVLNQRCQRIIVGDPNQAIYSFRNAVDAFDKVSFPVYPLTQSFRFGEEIARVANLILEAKGIEHRLVGNPEITSKLTKIAIPDLVLSRTNAGLFSEAAALMRVLPPSDKIAFNGGADVVMDMVISAYHLYKHGRCDHPDFKVFSSWTELVQLAEAKLAENFGPFVRIVQTHNDDIPAIVAGIISRSTNAEADARVLLSTVHTFKGREKNTVRIASDFSPFCTVNKNSDSFEFKDEEANIAYVGLTRARYELDLTHYFPVLLESRDNAKRMREMSQMRLIA